MKKVLFALCAAWMVAAGCEKESIFTLVSGNDQQASSGVEGSTTFDVTEDKEDDIAGTEFSRTITVTFSGSGASVEGDVNGIVTIDGNGVTVNNTTTSEKVKYILKGSTSNGFFKVYSNNKQALVLDGVSITNPSGAAINNQSHKRCFVVVNGTNFLADGATYTTVAEEDQKAAFFSEGQLIFSGTGSLEVSAKGKSGITSDDYIHVTDGPTLRVTSTGGHGIRGKDAIMVDGGDILVTVSADMKKGMTSDSLVVFNGGSTVINVSGGTAYDSEEQEYKASAGVKADHTFVMNGGSLTITNSGQGGKGISGDGNGYFQGGTISVSVTGTNYGSSSSGGGPGSGGRPRATTTTDSSTSAKGIKFDGNIYVSGGDVSASVANHEAIEAKGLINITGGTVYAQSKDDAINSAGDMVITDGHVCAYSTGNDGLDANGNLYVEGGVVYAIGSGTPEVAIDANTEQQKKLYVNGGVLFTIGGLENGSSLSQSCYQASSWSKNTWYALTVGSTTYCFKTPSSGGSGLVLSGASKPSLESGVTPSGGTEEFNGMAVFGGSASGGSSVSLSSYTSGSGWGPGGGW
ncbi:MAG: carbohydrate-binding domain-containing protein [Bacteroidales bacterium]|nr:carbohydrate-binding domain-containing protein [Bacteroidales bacterium]